MMIGRIFSGILALLRFLPASALPSGDAGSKTAGALNGIGTIGAIAGAGMWILGPGREWQITLNALELSGLTISASMLIEWARNLPPPGAS